MKLQIIFKYIFALQFTVMLFYCSSCKEDVSCDDNIMNQDETGIDCGGVCAACPTCTDGIMNQDETGIDCGGSCIVCGSCSDGILNQNEVGIDCGGVCSPCNIDCNLNFAGVQPPGSTCNDNNPNSVNDQYSLDCICMGILAPTCTDGILNQAEVGIDCGGPCAPCSQDCNSVFAGVQAPGSGCDDNNPNSINDTYNLECICIGIMSGSCSDGILNQNETGIDCGGSCTPCMVDCDQIMSGIQAIGSNCNDNNPNTFLDEYNESCICMGQAPSCTDGILNQGEITVDCGGPCDVNAGVVLGQFYQGGYIAHILEPSDIGFDPCITHGIIASSSDVGVAVWGCYGFSVLAEGLAIGTGTQNTDEILAGCSTIGIAADICADFSNNGYDDWFLPSIDELDKIYTNLYVQGIATFNFSNTSFYWSSSNGDAQFAWFENFYNGYQGLDSKVGNYNIRPVRKF